MARRARWRVRCVQLAALLLACSSPKPCSAPVRDGEACIPGGTFRMGHAAVEGALNDWLPEHDVTL